MKNFKSVRLPVEVPVIRDGNYVGTCLIDENGIGDVKINEPHVLESVKNHIFQTVNNKKKYNNENQN